MSSGLAEAATRRFNLSLLPTALAATIPLGTILRACKNVIGQSRRRSSEKEERPLGVGPWLIDEEVDATHTLTVSTHLPINPREIA
jgi:hypothetical protein